MRQLLLLTLALALALLGLALPIPAIAHGHLVRSVPQAGGVATASLAEIRTEFTEAIEARFSGLELAGPNGQRITTGRVKVEGATMVVPLTQPLAVGRYRVNWRVLSVDSHRTKGSFTFEVRP